MTDLRVRTEIAKSEPTVRIAEGRAVRVDPLATIPMINPAARDLVVVQTTVARDLQATHEDPIEAGNKTKDENRNSIEMRRITTTPDRKGM